MNDENSLNLMLDIGSRKSQNFDARVGFEHNIRRGPAKIVKHEKHRGKKIRESNDQLGPLI